MAYEIYGDFDELVELTRGISVAPRALRKATARALNRTAVSCRAELARMITKEYRLTQKAVKKELWISRARENRLEAAIRGEGSPGIPLKEFAPTPKRVPSTIHRPGTWHIRRTWWGKVLKTKYMSPGSDSYTPKVGIKVMVHRGKRKVVRGAFLARMPSGHIGVFRRAGDNRWGVRSRRQVIEELYGPSPLRIIESDAYQIALDDYAGEVLDRNMNREAAYYLKKAGVLPDV